MAHRCFLLKRSQPPQSVYLLLANVRLASPSLGLLSISKRSQWIRKRRWRLFVVWAFYFMKLGSPSLQAGQEDGKAVQTYPWNEIWILCVILLLQTMSFSCSISTELRGLLLKMFLELTTQSHHLLRVICYWGLLRKGLLPSSKNKSSEWSWNWGTSEGSRTKHTVVIPKIPWCNKASLTNAKRASKFTPF